jgi:hypothetical protein
MGVAVGGKPRTRPMEVVIPKAMVYRVIIDGDGPTFENPEHWDISDPERMILLGIDNCGLGADERPYSVLTYRIADAD